MSSLTNFNGLEILTPDPTGVGGKAINDNFKKTSTKLDTSNPDENDDADDGFGVGSRWVNIASGAEFVCTDNSVGAAAWFDLSSIVRNNFQSGLFNSQSGNYNSQSGSHNIQSGGSNTQSGDYNTQSGYHNAQGGAQNTQTGNRGTQSGGNNTQSGAYNTQNGELNTQSGYFGLQAGDLLDDGGFDRTYMFGSNKTATVSDTAYFYLANGIRLPVLSTPPSNPENGTIYVDSTNGLCIYFGGGWKKATLTPV